MIEKLDALGIQDRKECREIIRRRHIRMIVFDAMLAEQFNREPRAISIACDFVKTIALQDIAEFNDNLFRAKWRPLLKQHVQNANALFRMANSQRKTVLRAAAWIDMRGIGNALAIIDLKASLRRAGGDNLG